MRIPPNPDPVIRIRNSLAMVAALLTIWLLLGLAARSLPPADSAAAVFPPGGQGSYGLHKAVTRFAPAGSIPLTTPLAPMHQRTWRQA